ncbi:hydrogenase maturation protease [Mycobacterium sp. MMS18-G62]
MTTAVVIGIGNSFRRDDGVGLVVAEEVAHRGLPDVRVVTAIGEPTAILEAWCDAPLAVVIDAATGEDVCPGRIRRWTPDQSPAPGGAVSSHAISLPQAYELGEALKQLPHQLVVLCVDVADTDYGPGLTPAVAAAVPAAVEAVFAELLRPQ